MGENGGGGHRPPVWEALQEHRPGTFLRRMPCIGHQPDPIGHGRLESDLPHDITVQAATRYVAHLFGRSSCERMTRAAFRPDAPQIPAPGNVPAPVRYRPRTGVSYLVSSRSLPTRAERAVPEYAGANPRSSPKSLS